MGFHWSFGYGAGNQSIQPLSVERDTGGNWFYRMFSSNGSFTSLTTDRQKIDIILKSAPALKVFKLNADLGSLGKVAEYKGDKFIEFNALKKKQAKPNKHQTWKQFFWDYFFYNPLGTAYLWRSNNTNLEFSGTSFYWLNPAKMEWGDIELKLDKLDLSKKAVDKVEELIIKYRFKDGSVKDIPLKEIQSFTNLSNSVSENWYKGNSCIDALYKVISNAEISLDAENVNLDYSRKFFVSGEGSMEDTSNLNYMSGDEKKNIEDTIDGEKKVHAIKTPIRVSRFVEDLLKLGYNETYLAKYFIIGSMFGIPRDVLEANLKGSTYENQEKSTGKHISYSLQPMADDLMEWFGDFMGIELRMMYNHLPFMQIFEKDRAETVNTKAEAFTKLVTNGLTKDEALKLTGLEL
jgi:hypothetical protein